MPQHYRPVAALLAWIKDHLLAAFVPRALLGTCALALVAAPGCKSKGAPNNAGTNAPMGTTADRTYGGPAPAERSDYGGDGYSDSYSDGYAEESKSYGGDYVAEADDAPAPSPEPTVQADSAMGTSASRHRGRASRRSARRERHAYRDTTSTPAPRPAPTHTPGLGTAYGERRHSSVVSTAFERDSASPDSVLSLWYNDWAGIESMAAAYGRRNTTTSSASSSDGSFVVQIIDEHGRTLPASDIDGRRYAAGHAGSRYKIRISNNSAFRFEVVTSVDGLDVIDGEDAAFHKRGYVLDAWSSITIDGWRTSDDTVAAFRFSDIEDSYAERKGKGRNVGVVGVAFFHERGVDPWRERARRHSSDPFPGRYAPPPPPRWR